MPRPATKEKHVYSRPVLSFSLRIYPNEEEDALSIDPIPIQFLSGQDQTCWLRLRIKHPLFRVQKTGLVAGIQYQGE